MKPLSLLVISLLLPVWVCNASNNNYPSGARAAALSNAAVTLSDFWAISHNQAALVHIKNITAGVYTENRFLVKELSMASAALVVPVGGGAAGVSFTTFGFSLYNESKTGITYAHTFSEKFSAALQLNYHHTTIAHDYGTKGTVSFETGMLYQLLPQVTIGVHLFNPSGARILSNERIPTIVRAGAAWQLSEKVLLLAETEKDLLHRPVFKAGIEYHIIQPLFFRVGIGTRPTTNSFGFGFRAGNIQVDLATSFHYVLGYSPQFNLVYHFQ